MLRQTRNGYEYIPGDLDAVVRMALGRDVVEMQANEDDEAGP